MRAHKWKLFLVLAILFLSIFAGVAQAAAPTISNLSPSSGAVGASVVITGTNFGSSQGSSTVKFNGTPATTVGPWSATSITAKVPTGATTGNVVVSVSNKASNGVSFTVVSAPSITSLSPASGTVGASVTITGANFGTSQGTSTVKFNGTTATPTSWGAGSIGVPVPSGATTGNVVVHASGVDSNGASFIVAPSISGLSTSVGGAGTSVTISGLNFGSTQGASTVSFNGALASPTSWNSTTVVTLVPTGASTGLVVVTVQGMVSNGLTFTVTPAINGVSPSSGPVGTLVTITGSAFGATQGTSSVSLSGTTVIPNSWSNTAIQVTVPWAASSGSIVVTVGGYASNNFSFTVSPSISGLSPAFGPVGTSVAISGFLFGTTQGTSTVTFNGVTATPTSWGIDSIMAPVPAGATTGPVVVNIGGSATNSMTFIVSGAITSLTPTSGASGAAVTIAGNGFGSTQGSSVVTFNGVAAPVSSWSSNSIVTTVPLLASSGPVVVTVGGASSNGLQFSVPPTITNISPTSGPVNTSVSVSGSSFGVTAGLITFNGVAATSTSWSPTRIVVSVPSGATTGPVVVSVGAFSSSGVTFTVGTGSITGTVTRAIGGTEISGALVEALQSNVPLASATTAADGTYTISNLNPGTYDVRVTASGFGTTVLAGYGVATGSPITVNAALSSPGSIAGTITRSDGITAISGASVTVLQFSDTAGTTSTDSSGNYTVSTLSPGSFTLQASATGFTAQSQSGVSVTGGNTTTVNLSLLGQSAITYDYDELGRLVGVVDSLSDAAAYRYDPVGNLVSISRNPVGQTSIIDFTPKSGPVGTAVTISGTAFSSAAGQNTVTFNGTSAIVSSATTSQIFTTVPTGATSGPIQVTSPGGTATSSGNFTVASGSGLPTITSFTPTVASAGTAITISGTNFDANPINDRLRFNTTLATISTASATSLAANLTAATASGKITVATPAGSTTSSQDLYVPFGTHVPADVGYTVRTSLGSPATVSIGTSGKIGLLLFDATAGQSVSLSLSGSTFSTCSLYLLGPTQVQLQSTLCTSGWPFIDSTNLPTTGTYTIGIDPGTATGSVTITPNNDINVLGMIAPGGPPVTVTTTVPGQDARLTFTGTAGQRVSLAATNVTNSTATIYLVRPDGTNQGSVGCNPCFMEPQTLATTGTYTIWVQHYSTNVGSDTLQLYNVPPDVTGTITIGGSPVSVATTVPGQNASLTISGTSGQKVSISLSSGSYSTCTLTLKNPDGSSLTGGSCSGATGFVDTATLGTTGTYTILIDPFKAATGGVTAQVNNDADFTGTITPSGSPVTVPTTVPGQDARLAFTGTAGQGVSLAVTNVTNPTATVYLVKPDGTNQTLIGANPSCNPCFMDTQTLATTGTYTIWVQHYVTNVGSETLQLYNVVNATGTVTVGGAATVVTISTPGQNAQLTFSGTSGQQVTVHITNNSIASATTVKLLNPSGATLTSTGSTGSFNLATQTLSATGTYTITVDPFAANTGSLSVNVTNP